MENFVGRIIKSYELQELIGEGGFGAVYRAHQQLIGREVAIKIILPHYANRPEFIRRFETEAQLVARLEHPHIVPLYDYWREPSGAYLVMRWLRGGSVQELLDREGPLSLSYISRIVNQICEALVVAHRQGVIHRDLKPENILLDSDGNAYLSDFGIAKDLTGEGITQNDAILGSPAYLSPEQIQGDVVTPQSDIYTMGIVLYELLTGERPFKDATPATLMYKHLSESIPDIREANPVMNEEVNAVLQKATAKSPADRYADAVELARAFRMAANSANEAKDFSEVYPSTVYTGTKSSGSLVIPEPENPYKGLRAFQQADADDFFGRDVLTLSILRRLQEPVNNSRFLAVVGPSGSGKSSVVKAGVIPELRRGAFPKSDKWFVVEMLPGIDPMEELEAALLRIAVNPPDSLLGQLNADERGLLRAVKRVLPEDTELLIVIDQFEELFTLVDDLDVRSHMMNSIYAAVTDPRSPVRIIVTLRADFYDRPLLYPQFGELMRARTEVVLPMNTEELERAITGPARRAGLHIEEGLTTTIVADINEQPGALPLLQYALTELFERRNKPYLTLEAYNEIGGTMGALARRADELYEGLDEDGQEISRQIFLRLVTLGEGAEDTRRRCLLSELLSLGNDSEEISMIIDAFGRYRLLTFDRDPVSRTATVEVAHEALIRQWGRLRIWLNESRDDLRTHRRLNATAEDWRHSNHDPSYLARGMRLQQFETWLDSAKISLNDLEREYLDASIQARQHHDDLERARELRETELEMRSRNRLRALVAVMSVAALLSFVLAVYALNQQQRAENATQQEQIARTEAEKSAAQAQSLALSANAASMQIQYDTTLALSLAIAANEVQQPPLNEVLRILADTAYHAGVRARFEGHTATVLSGDISSDRQFTVSASADGTAIIWDNNTREQVRQIVTENEIVSVAKFSPDGSMIALAGSNGDIGLYDAETGDIIRTLSGHDGLVTTASFLPDGGQLLTGSTDHTVRLWDVATGEELRVFDDENGVVLKIDVSADGAVLAVSYGDDTMVDGDPLQDRAIRVWDIATGDLLQTFSLGGGWVRSVAINSDGTRVAGAIWGSALGGTIHLLDVESGEEVSRIFGHTDLITGLLFTPDDSKVITASRDRTLRVWDAEKGIELQRFDVFSEPILDISLSEDSEYLAVFTGNIGANEILRANERSVDPVVWLIDLKKRTEIATFAGSRDWIWSMDVHPSGEYALSGSGALRPELETDLDNAIRIWNIATQEVLLEISGADNPHTSTIEGIQFSADGDYFVSSGWEGKIVLWAFDADAMTASVEWVYEVGEGVSILNTTISPDGELIAGGLGNGQVVIVGKDGELIRQFGDHTNSIAGIRFSPDGAKLLTGSYDHTAVIWDVATGERLVDLLGHSDRINDVTFTPDGRYALTASWDVSARLWDVETGQMIRQFTGHTDRLQTVTTSADGRLMLTAGADQTLRLWNIETGQELFQFDGHTNWVSHVTFMPNGSSALSSGQDNVLRLWHIPTSADEIIAWAERERYVRPLTCSEREQFRVTPFCDLTTVNLNTMR